MSGIDNKKESAPTDFIMSIQSDSHKNGNGGSELQNGDNGGSESQKDINRRYEISNGTYSKEANLVESSGSTIDGSGLSLSLE